MPAREDDNFAALQSLDWQIHVYGQATSDFLAAANGRNITVQQFTWSRIAEDAGLLEGAIYLVRPDGHIALATTVQDFTAVAAYAAGGRKALERLALEGRNGGARLLIDQIKR